MALKYDKAIWKKERNTYNHLSGDISIRPVYSNIGRGDIVGYKIFFFSSNGMMRECKSILDGEKTLLETMQKAIEKATK